MQISEKRKAQLLAGPYTHLLAEHEAALSVFYDTLAMILKNAEPFWRTLAKEELDHKDQIEKMQEKFHNGECKFQRPMFMTSAILDSLEWIAARKFRIEREGISMRDALKAALELESNIIESNFFEVLDGDDPKTMEIIETQKANTKAHVRRIQLEARRLKWRIFGGKKVLPTDTVKALSRKELKDNIKASQANMLGMLISMEEAASRLYIAYSERWKETSDFWAKLAAEEMQHSNMLRKLYKILEDGKVFHNVEHFGRKALEEMIEFIIDAEFDARYSKLSSSQIVCTAMRIERSMLESGFYVTVTSDSAEFQIISKRLVELTKTHISKIEVEMIRTTSQGESSKKNLPVLDEKE